MSMRDKAELHERAIGYAHLQSAILTDTLAEIFDIPVEMLQPFHRTDLGEPCGFKIFDTLTSSGFPVLNPIRMMRQPLVF